MRRCISVNTTGKGVFGNMQYTKKDVIEAIKKHKIVAILRKVPTDKLQATVEALYSGGIRLMEVTFDPSGEMPEKEILRQIRFIADHFEGVFAGAGTVLEPEQVTKAAQAGAKYIISPNSDEAVIRQTVKEGLVSMPGALTPTEIMNAHRWGADFVKLFPIGTLGTAYIKAVKAPLNQVKLLAVGGVNENNITEFLDAGCYGAGIGGNLVNKKWIENEEFEKITETASKLTEIVKGWKN